MIYFSSEEDGASVEKGGAGLTMDEEYKDFKPVKTILPATLSILASFAMIVAVRDSYFLRSSHPKLTNL